MNRYSARDLLALPVEQLWALPEERHIVVFDDGELTTHTRATIMSVYLWWPLVGTDYPLLREYHLGDLRFTSKVMLKLINRVIWGMHTASGELIDPEDLSKLAFDTVNRVYNDFTTKLSSYVATLSMFDLVEVMYHPEIKAANAEVEPTEYSIEEVCYKRIRNTFNDPTQLRGNPLAESSRSGTLKMDQILQGVGPRGYITDISSEIFPFPITKGYAEGIDDLYGAMIESRTGTKSLAFNKELLRGTEYFNRKTQLVAQYVQRVHPGDCGRAELVEFPVISQLLPKLRGKYYLNNGKLDILKGNEEHLVGTKIRMRSVLGCVHTDPQGVCSVCYGRMFFSVPKGTNIGHFSAVSVGDKITSSVLSTKHLDSTSKVEKFLIHATEAKYLRYGKVPETLYLRPQLEGKTMQIKVMRSEVQSLADVLMLSDLEDYPVTSASQITQMYITVDEGEEGQSSDVLRVSLYNRKASFSRELLEFIRTRHWTHDEKDNVVIDITGFDINQPFLSLPYKHVNMYEVMMRIQSFLHSGTENDNSKLGVAADRAKRGKQNFLRNYKDPVEALAVFATMLNEKLSVNIVHCEILVYAMMVRSSLTRDYRLPVPGTTGVFEKYNTLMLNRSLSAAMAFEKQDKPMISPRSFIYKNRNDHPYDFILMGGKMD